MYAIPRTPLGSSLHPSNIGLRYTATCYNDALRNMSARVGGHEVMEGEGETSVIHVLGIEICVEIRITNTSARPPFGDSLRPPIGCHVNILYFDWPP